MTTLIRRRLRVAALVSAVIGLTLAIVWSLPDAVDQRQAAAEATAAPNVAALAARNASDEAKTPTEAPTPSRSPNLGSGAPPGTRGKIPSARITVYHATAAETDGSPCSGAMRGVDFCNPPFPIIANNCLKLGTIVKILGTQYTVADRMPSHNGCTIFDVLNGDGLPDHADVYVL